MLPKIKVSDNQRFLVTEAREPFFWLGDTAWELFHLLDLEEAAHYLENRRQKGFNVIQAVVLAERDGLRIPNANGDLPLIDLDPTKPNDAYFAHVDTVIQMAADKGLYIGLLPTWGDKVNLAWGLGPVIFNEDNARIYGEYIGSRYKDQSNIIWINGGDREENTDGVDYVPIWRALGQGIKSQADQIMSYHPKGGRGSSLVFHDDDWLDFNMWQSGHGDHDRPTWEHITLDYNRVPIKPVFDGEPNYEDHPIGFNADNGYFRDYATRKQAYRAVFAGGFGHTYGHHSVWQMHDHHREPINAPDRTWKEALDRPGASQMIHLKNLILSRPFLTRIPDQSIIKSDMGEGGQHIRATRDTDGTYVMVYSPESDRVIDVDLSILQGNEIIAHWYDPRTGNTTPIGTYPTNQVLSFVTPKDGPDWVLVLDARQET